MEMKRELERIHARMDQLDEGIVKYFEQRMDAALELAAYKQQHNLPILDSAREQQVLMNNLAMLGNPTYAQALESLLEKLMLLSRNLQLDALQPVHEYPEFVHNNEVCSAAKVGFQGVAGSFSQQALHGYFKDTSVQEYNYLNFEDVFVALQKSEIDYGVLPIENSSTGAINDIYDLLNKYDVCISGEYCLAIEQCLLAKPGTKIADIQRVYSHPQGFSQSKEFLKDHNWKLVPYFNTAKSAEYVANNPDRTIAAIAGAQAVKLYNLTILQEKINFNGKNSTRFVILSRQKQIAPHSNKVSLIISLPHKSGSLARVLNYFEEYNINLLKLESRPNQQESWSYYFYIDFNGHLQESHVHSVLSKVKADSLYFKLLGNYPSVQL